MPREARDAEEIQQIKENILDEAQDILTREGWQSLSMRKIAARVNMTATNLYNYFRNKDEIYLVIQKRGFQTLVDRFLEIEEEEHDPKNRVQKAIRAYIDFGVNNPEQYEIMFTKNTPKYADYRGTEMEAVAADEKDTALKVAEIASRSILEIYGDDPKKAEVALRRTVLFWVTLHGIVSLLNSRVLHEVIPDTDTLIESFQKELTEVFEATTIKDSI